MFEQYKIIKFLGIDRARIPANPDYCLKKAYGSDYMTFVVGPTWNHRYERPTRRIMSYKD